MRRQLSAILLAIFLVMPLSGLAEEYSSTNFKVESPDINAGGAEGTSASFQVNNSIPFIEDRDVSSASYQIISSRGGAVFRPPVVSAQSGPDYSQVQLSWTAATGVSNPTYQVGTASQSGGPYTYSVDSTSGLTATVSGLSFSQRYYFVVRTYEGTTLQAQLSNEASAYPQAFPASSGGGGGSGGGSGPAPAPLVYPPSPAPVIVFPSIPAAPPASGGVAGVIDTVFGAISDLFGRPPYVVGEIPLALIVPQRAPFALSGRWSLIPDTAIREYVFRPLPLELRNLASRLPQLSKIFSEVGITRFNDLEKLKNVSLKVPGLSDVLALPSIRISGGSVVVPRQLRIAELTPDLKAKFPSGVLFTKFAGGLVDVKPNLRLDKEGNTEQVIRTITGRNLTLSVRPEFSASSVVGYLVFKHKTANVLSDSSRYDSLFSISRAHAAEAPSAIETALVVDAFEYSDSNKDGIYTAEIAAPVATGEYEIITAIAYQDANRGTKLIRMITVVDPEGYVYEFRGGKEIRVPGAIVTLEWLNPATDSYEKWPAGEYSQENPVITDVTGQYAFLVPPGLYQLRVAAPGYSTYDGHAFTVTEGAGVHENLQLQSTFNFLEILDWKTIMIILVLLLVLYNFHRDRMRERVPVEPAKTEPPAG